MWLGHCFNETCPVTGPWALAFHFFSIPQMLHDLPPLLAFCLSCLLSGKMPLSRLLALKTTHVLHLLEAYL